MGKHELALQHAMKALILIQDELISRFPTENQDLVIASSNGDETAQAIKRPEDRLIVLCIAYHNIAVE
jgi:hypothetical protein